MSFQEAMKFIGKWEWSNRPDGGYNNRPQDAGGPTKFGIAQRSHPSVDVRNLTLQKAWDIYKKEYWDFYKCGELPTPLDIVAMDAYVQHSPRRVQQWLNEVKGVEGRKAAKLVIEKRRAYYNFLIQKTPSQKIFEKGWMNRMNDLSKLIDIVE